MGSCMAPIKRNCSQNSDNNGNHIVFKIRQRQLYIRKAIYAPILNLNESLLYKRRVKSDLKQKHL